MRSARSRFQTVERAIVAAIRAHPQRRATRPGRAKKRWLKILGRKSEGLLIRFQGLPCLFVNVHQIEAAAFTRYSVAGEQLLFAWQTGLLELLDVGRSRSVSKLKCDRNCFNAESILMLSLLFGTPF